MSDDTRVTRPHGVGAHQSNWVSPYNTGWFVIILFGLLLPGQRAADWFRGAYSASERDLTLGVLILKVALITLGATAVAVGRRAPADREQLLWFLRARRMLRC